MELIVCVCVCGLSLQRYLYDPFGENITMTEFQGRTVGSTTEFTGSMAVRSPGPHRTCTVGRRGAHCWAVWLLGCVYVCDQDLEPGSNGPELWQSTEGERTSTFLHFQELPASTGSRFSISTSRLRHVFVNAHRYCACRVCVSCVCLQWSGCTAK